MNRETQCSNIKPETLLTDYIKSYEHKIPPPRHYDSLNGLRGIAVLFVIFSHAANKGLVFIEGFSMAGSGSGQVGVFLFFVLSAFLLTDQMLKLKSRENLLHSGYINTYIKRRFLRIFPLYTVFLVVLWLTALIVAPNPFARFAGFDFEMFLKHFFLFEGKAHLWTVHTEFKFYIILPALCFLLIAFKEQIFKLAGILCFLSASSFAIYFLSDISLFLYLPIFLCGVFTACLFNKYPAPVLTFSKKQITGVTSFLCLTLLLIIPKNLAFIAGVQKINMLSPLTCSFYGIFWGSFIMFLLWYDSLLNKILKTRFLCFVGLISYSVYLWHWLILDILVYPIFKNHMVSVFIFYPAALIISFLSYRYIERPFLQIKTPRRKS